MTKLEARRVIDDAIRCGIARRRTVWGPWIPADAFFRLDEFSLLRDDADTLELMRGDS